MAEEIDYRALYEQAQRDLQEEKRARLQDKIEADRARAAERDAKAVVSRLAERIAELQRPLENLALQPYLGLTARLGIHFARLIPLPRSRPEQIAVSSGSNPASKAKSGTTSGRTKIQGKYYPLRLRVWSDFPDLHKSTFSRVYTTMADRRTLPSHQAVQLAEQELLDRNPVDAIQMEKVLNERKTAQFLETLLETPTYRVLREYFTAIAADKWLFFDTTTHAAAAADHTPSSSSAGTGTGTGSSSSTTSQNHRTQPDVVVLAVSAAAAAAAGPATAVPDAEPHRVVLGEHKPLHALRHSAVTEIQRGPLPETYMVRLARAATRRHASADGAGQDGPSDPPPDTADASGSRGRRAVPKQVYFAYALTQIYHYMLLGGLEYGYIATGETLILLHIPENEPSTLLYHTAVFPVPSPQGVSSYSGPVALEPPSDTTDLTGEEALAALPVAQLASLCLLAFDSTPRTPLWVSRVLLKLAMFPQLPEGLPSTASSPSSLGTRRRRDDDDDDDDSSDGGGSSRGRTLRPPGGLPGSQARVPSPLQHVTSVVSSSGTFPGGSQSMHMPLPPATQHVVVRPHLPYCTQACLLGLVRNGPLDRACPNYLLHKRAATMDDSLPLTPALSPAGEGQDRAADAGGKDDVKVDGKDGSPSRHPLSLEQLQELVRTQLFDGPEDHCENLDGRGHYGAIGHLFKISVKVYGYTFVAKGVEADRRRHLAREAAVYARLQAQQGCLVPVYLGLLKLRAPYALLSRFLALPYMLLLSYAGATVSSIVWERDEANAEGTPPRGPADAPDDLDGAMARTHRELWRLGLRDGDARDANFTWCAEAQRVMRIDFDRSSFVDVDGPAAVKRKGDQEAAADQPVEKRAKHADRATATEDDMPAGR